MNFTVGACVGIVGTTINSRVKLRQLQQVMTESNAESISQVQEKLAVLSNHINDISKLSVAGESEMSTDSSNSNNTHTRIDSSLKLISSQIDEFSERLERVQQGQEILLENHNPEIIAEYRTNSSGDLSSIKSNYSKFENKPVILSTACIIVFVPIITTLLGIYFGNN